MASHANRFQVGIFVIVAGVIALGTAIWLGATSFLRDTETFVTYFSESVQGLDPGSAVKYRGVPAGRVGDIRIAPDGELIEVVMDIDSDMALFLRHDASLRAKLELAGITGLRYVEIEPRSGELLNQAPALRFKPAHEMIPSASSSFQALQQALGDIYERAMQLDVGGISDDVRTTLQAARRLLADERIPTILDNLDRTSAAAVELTGQLQRGTEGLDLNAAIANATAASAEARDLFTNLNRVAESEIPAATHELVQLAQSAQLAMSSLQYTLDRLDRTIGGLRDFTDELRLQPSRLLFSSPPQAGRDLEAQP